MKRDEKNQQSKLKIINAALEEFGENDYFTASTNNICKNNGISKGLLFHYFGSKDEIFMVCVRTCFDELSLHIEEHIPIEVGTIEEMLGIYMECRMEFFEKYPYYKKIFHTAVFNTPDHLAEEIEQARKKLHEVNELFLIKLLESFKLKENVKKSEIISVIIEFGNFLLSKHRLKDNDEEFMKEPIEEFIQMMKMLFYGIIQE